MKTLIKISAAVLVAALAGIALPLALAGDTEPPTAGAPRTEEGNQVAHLSVKGMISDSCPAVAKMTLGGIDGVLDVDASYPEGTATVVFDPSLIDAETIAAILARDTGFEVELVAVEAHRPRLSRVESCSVPKHG